MKIQYLVLLFFVLSGCMFSKKNEKYADFIQEIDLVGALKKQSPLKLSAIAQSVDYIPLETQNSHMINASLDVYENDDYLVISAFRQLYLFDRLSGKFVREIGHYGKDPGGYQRIAWQMPFQETGTLFTETWEPSTLAEYSLEGEILRKITIPVVGYTHFFSFKDKLIVYVQNIRGNEAHKLVVFNEDSIVKVYPNLSHFPQKKKIDCFQIIGGQGQFYQFKGKLNFFEKYTDTIFHVGDKNLEPRFAFKMGKYDPPYEKQQDCNHIRSSDQFMLIKDIYETDQFVCFTVGFRKKKFAGLYMKESRQAFLSDSKTYENDIDNFAPFTPIKVSKGKYMIGYIHAMELVDWFENHPEQIERLPKHLQEFRKIKEDDNPVIMIAKLKKI
ncbi:MAG: 6-bladed beta-propeller [Cytophagales bacterium]|nr:6-bladed beta-propeller [Cytophagales bacterium]